MDSGRGPADEERLVAAGVRPFAGINLGIGEQVKKIQIALAMAALSVAMASPAAADEAAKPTMTVTVSGAAPSAAAHDGYLGRNLRKAGWMNCVATSYTDWRECLHQYDSITGSRGTMVTYTWTVPPGSNSRVAVQGKWFDYNPNTGGFDTRWGSLGAGTSGSATFRWGNVLANPATRAKIQVGFLGGAYSFRF